MKGIFVLLCVVFTLADKRGLIKLDKSNHEEIIKNSEYVIVKFFSPHCPHCMRFAPTYSEFSVKLQKDDEKVVVAELDCTKFRDLCGMYKIRAYPTVNFYKKGELIEKFTQQRTVDNLINFVEKNKK